MLRAQTMRGKSEHLRVLIFAFATALSPNAALSQSRVMPSLDKTIPFYVTLHRDLLRAASSSEVIFSPRGKYVLFRTDSLRLAPYVRGARGDSVILLSSDCLFRASHPRCPIATLETPIGIQSAYFSDDDSRFFALDGLNRVTMWSVDGVLSGSDGSLLDQSKLQFRTSPLRIAGSTPSQSADAEKVRLTKEAFRAFTKGEYSRGEYELSAISVDSRGWVGSVYADSQLSTTVQTSDHKFDLEIGLPYIVGAQVYRSATELAVLGKFGLYSLVKARPSLIENARAGIRPVLDPLSGMVIGDHNETSVNLYRSRINIPPPGGSTTSLWALAFDPTRYRAVVITQTLGKGQDLWIYGSKKMLPTQICCATPVPKTVLKRELVELGSDEYPLPARRYLPRDPNGRYLVLLHGGPVSSAQYDNETEIVESATGLGFTVLTLDFSGAGSPSPGVSTRLANLGATAIEMDSKLLSSYLASIRATNAVFYAESYGAIYFSALKQDPAFSDFVLVAPWLRHRDPGAWIRDSDGSPDEAQSSYWRRHERSVFGVGLEEGPRGLASLMNGVRADCRTRGDLLIVVGEKDLRSRKEDLGSCLTIPKSKVVEISGKDHGDTLRESWSPVQSFLTSSKLR